MKKNRFRLIDLLLFFLLTLAVALLCLCVGSVSIPLKETVQTLLSALRGAPVQGAHGTILTRVRLPRVLCAGLIGAALSLSGAAMQGLLRNPLSDGSTLGISSGASLGAALSILLGISLPGLPLAATAVAAMIFAFLTLLAVLSLAWSLDHSLQTNTIILVGMILSMLVSSLMSLLVAFAGDKLRAIAFWTMGSLDGASYAGAAVMAAVLLVCGGALLMCAEPLNAFALGEEQALHLGVSVRRVKLTVMIAVSALLGVSVAIGGCIGFVGLAVPHITRLIVRANHRRLLPACAFGGAIFLMLCDLAARTVLSPAVLPLGAVTSVIGAAVFLCVYFRAARKERP